MSRYNPDHQVDLIYDAAQQWRERSLIGQQSVFSESASLWTADLLDELDERFVKRPDVSGADFFSKLEKQLSEGSSDCKQLMAECLWLFFLFPAKDKITPAKKREHVCKVWSWSGYNLDENHPLLKDGVLGGIGSPGPAYNQLRARELSLLIGAIRDLRSRESDERDAIIKEPWKFSDWLSSLPEARKRQLIHILPHLLFPDKFERISSKGNKCQILAGIDGISEKETGKWSTVKIDQALFDLRRRIEGERGNSIDFYQDEYKDKWQPQATPRASNPAISKSAYEMSSPSPSAVGPPVNLILYGPPGTGKTYCLKNKYLPQYQGSADDPEDRFEFVTFHQSYAYEDFVEGIRPKTVNGTIIYEVVDGVLKRICKRAIKTPGKRFALFIDEINRGNVSKIFGELITLVELDKRIYSDDAGTRRPDCNGLEVTLPYSGDHFGVPANVDVIGTMNTADRSIALLDSALRRRFQFEELTPNAELLNASLDDGEGGVINLQLLLQRMNERLSHLLHRDQTLGHSYLFNVKSFDDLRRIFAREILPFLQEAFYDDWRQIRYVLADQAKHGEFQLVRLQTQNTASLFPGVEPSEIGESAVFEIIGENDITPDMIRKIYEMSE